MSISIEDALRKRRVLNLPCRHGLIIANSGEGKTHVLKTDIADILATTNDNIVILDMFGSFNSGMKFQEASKATHSFGTDKELSLNIFNLPSTKPAFSELLESNMFDKIDMFVAMIHMTGIRLTPKERFIISQAVKRCYKNMPEGPTMDAVIKEILKEGCDAGLASAICEFARVQCFGNKTNIMFDKKLTVIETSSLGNFNRVVAIPVLDHLLQVAYQDFKKEKKNTWVYIPHIDTLMSDSDNYIDLFLRRARQHAIVCTGTAPKEALSTRGFTESLVHFSSLYLMAPSSKDKGWFDIMGTEPEGFA